MLFPLHVVKHKNVILCNLRMTVLIWFRRWCGIFNSFINIIPDQQMEDQAITEKRTCAVLIMLFFFFPPWSLLTESRFAIFTSQGVYSQEMSKKKLKSSGKSMIHVEAGTENKLTSLSFSPFLSCKIFILTDRYPIILDLFSYMGKLWPRFCQESKSVGKYLLSIYYMRAHCRALQTQRWQLRMQPHLLREPED